MFLLGYNHLLCTLRCFARMIWYCILETSINISSKLTQPRAEYMDLTEIRADENKSQSADQGADYAALHPSTRSWEVERDQVTVEK